MFSAPTAHLILAIIVLVSIVLMLVRPRDIGEVYWIGAGVVLLLALRLMPLRLAERAAAKGSDVYFFLMGMMLLSELARAHGVFDWVSAEAVHHANGSSARLFLLVYALGTAITVFMSNDATAVVLTPAILFAVRKAGVTPLPYLFVCAFIANAASFVLPISNPANLVVFGNHMPPLAEWLIAFGLPSLFSIAATFVVLRWIFRQQLRREIGGPIERIQLPYHGRLVLGGLAATAVVLLLCSAFDRALGLPTCLTALAVTAVLSVTMRRSPLPLFKGISWSTLALVAGLFVMVDAVETMGAMNHTLAWLAEVERMPTALGSLMVGFAVGLANNLVNNLPLGLIAGSTLRAAHASAAIASAVLIGVDLGPNLSITGSLATILWLIELRKEEIDVSFWAFFKVGVIAMPLALALALCANIFMQLLLRIP